MNKLILIISFIAPFYTYGGSGGNGAGNGGHGLICEAGQSSGPKVTILRDIAENIERHYSNNYFKNRYLRRNTIIARYLDINPYEYTIPKSFQDGIERLKVEFSDIFKQEVQTSFDIVQKLFTPKELRAINAKKNIFVNETNFLMPSTIEFFNNYTKDKGEAKNLRKKLMEYHLFNCQEAQIAVLQSYSFNQDYTHQLIMPARQLQYIDDLSFKALLWHEVVYLAVDDDNSTRIRNIVSIIIEDLYGKL